MNDTTNKVKKKKRKLIKRRVAFFAITFSLVILLGLGVAYFYNANRPMYAGVVLPATERGFEVVETPAEWSALEKELVMEVEERVRLVMVGDMLMHLRVTQSGRMEDGTYNYDHIFEHVKEDIQAADLAIVNQEIILGGPDLGYRPQEARISSISFRISSVSAGLRVSLVVMPSFTQRSTSRISYSKPLISLGR